MLRRFTTRVRPGSFTRAGARSLWVAAALVVLPSISLTSSADAVEPPRAAVQPASPQDDLAVLHDASLTPDARTAACRRLLNSPEPAAAASLVATLGPNGRAGSEVPSIVAREIGLLPNVSDTFLPHLEAWLKESTPDKHVPLYRAISSIRTRAAARLLLSYAGPSATAEKPRGDLPGIGSTDGEGRSGNGPGGLGSMARGRRPVDRRPVARPACRESCRSGGFASFSARRGSAPARGERAGTLLGGIGRQVSLDRPFRPLER